MITVHHLEYSQSFRVLWLMEALGVPYTLKLYARDKTTNLAPADYKAISPLGTSPVITIGDMALSETNAIIDYILDMHDDGRLRPEKGNAAREDYLFWYHASQGSLMPMLTFEAVFGVLKKRVPALLRPLIKTVLGKAEDSFVKPRLKLLMDKAEADLSRHKWFAGDSLTAADIVMSYCMESAKSRGYVTEAHINCQRWLDQMHSDPAYQAAMAKDGKSTMVFSL
ncbi:glutathione S-transferase [Litorimonas taeanensis]|uniref:Glutathione S-transferase n=1 Tax=Litorimonas taeanensis TaxID=568099 RepID=A0A420WF74_9PROT|nr:glutathione S-transferase [Litorimonas taeanensis]RKQ69633.1 glutathione S-transferase [Litorimonas taeanensis]